MYWSKAPVSGRAHPALRAHTTTLIGSNVYVFGGCDSRACFRDLYVLDADAFHWSTPHVVGDVPVPLRAMTCTAVGKKLVIFGGGDGPAYYNDVYVLDTVSFRWSKPRILGDKAPSKRRAHTACLYKNGIYVFGGGDGVRALNDIWRLDVADINKMSWKLVSGPSSAGTTNNSSTASSPSDRTANGLSSKDLRPKARGYHTANMVGSKLIIFGGSDGGECFNDVWVYDVETGAWKPVLIPVTFRRLSHTATIVGSYLFVIGGHDGNEYSNDVLLLNLVTMTWDKRRVYGLPPSGRGYHGTILYDSRLLTIGGFDGAEVFSDVWILELAVHAYYSQISHFTIEV
jgi:N-acetylneuraminic acid mutarotase